LGSLPETNPPSQNHKRLPDSLLGFIVYNRRGFVLQFFQSHPPRPQGSPAVKRGESPRIVSATGQFANMFSSSFMSVAPAALAVVPAAPIVCGPSSQQGKP
jgi:hypothetical protein